MNDIIDTAEDFGTLYEPKSALFFYESLDNNETMYVEHFDMDRNGNPVNAHPLTVNEAKALAKSLHSDEEKDKTFLKQKGILPTYILNINPSQNGSVIWYTKAQPRQMYFVKNLEISNGTAGVPAMLWYADNEIEYGSFFTQEMFDEDLRYMNEDEEGKTNLPHYERPISKETYYSLLFGAGNCFGDIGTFCVKISCVTEEDIKIIKTLQEFSKTPEFNKYVNFSKSKNLRRLLNTEL